ncbi:transcriptional regulator [Cytobacillus firmus]
MKNKIKEIRKKLGITQKRPAQECSVAMQTINCIEITNTIPHWSLLKYLKTLNVKVDELFIYE